MAQSHSTTIEDVARAAGVSRAAVSKVIRDAYGVSETMRAKVQAAIDELGYRPRASARAMRGSSYTLGVELPNIHNFFFPKVIDGVTSALADTRYQLLLAPTGAGDSDAPIAMEALLDHQVDGIISIGSRVSETLLESFAEQVPLVIIGHHYASELFDTVVSDDAGGAELAVRHLYDLGHRRIAHVTLLDGTSAMIRPESPHRIRLDSYRRVMASLGLPAEVVYTDSSEEAAKEVAAEWLSRTELPLAVFAAHDELALGVMAAAAELGLTKDEISVVGYDDAAMADHPLVSLTSVNQSGTRMGVIAVRLLLERISGRSRPSHEILPPRLMARGSSRPLLRHEPTPAPHNAVS